MGNNEQKFNNAQPWRAMASPMRYSHCNGHSGVIERMQMHKPFTICHEAEDILACKRSEWQCPTIPDNSRQFQVQDNFVLIVFCMAWRLVRPVLDGSKLPLGPRTIKPLRCNNKNLCFFALGNGLMNDAWLGQTVDPSKTGRTSLIYFRWLRENKIVLIPGA